MADNKGDDGLFLFIFFLVVVWGGGYLTWKFFKPQITTAIIATRSVEMSLASLWTDDDDVLKVPIKKEIEDDKDLQPTIGKVEEVEVFDAKFGTWKTFTKKAEYEDIQPGHIQVMTYTALYPLRWVFVGIFAALGLWTVFFGPTSRFHRVLGLEGLMVDQSKTFKVIRPFLKFNPNALPNRAPGTPVPSELPIFAEALGPEEWIAVNEIPMPDGKMDTEAAEKAFAQQLGPRWRGAKDLPSELQVLLAGFCLKASRKRDEADELLGRLAACWDHENGIKLRRDSGLLREARRILKDKKLSEITLMSANRHAYVSTALIRALNTAREEGGVLAPAQFVWLRAHNRGLWYPLNNHGRQAYHIEALGAAAHYRAEKQINRPIPRPRVGDAVLGMLEHLNDPVMARPVPPVDYSASKRKRKNKNTGIMKPKTA